MLQARSAPRIGAWLMNCIIECVSVVEYRELQKEYRITVRFWSETRALYPPDSWGTIVAVPQMIPLTLIHSANLALALAVPIGLLGGVATAAYFDLAMRSCPPGLQGTLMMLVDGVLALSNRGGDLLGSRIYNSSPAHGFLYCVIATTIVYALILPLILLVPKELIATADGEPNPRIAAEVLEEIAETGPD